MTRLYRAHRSAIAFAAGLGLLLSAGVALADQIVPLGNGWQTYVNDRYGMRFDVPADFQPGAPPENGDGRTFEKGDASIYIFASHNLQNDTPASFKRQLIGTKGYEDVTYSPSGGTWLVISGFRGSRIFYEKYFFHDDVISAFGMDFPKEEKPVYAPVIEHIEDSFRGGKSD
jgi:hypothetical protein